MLLLDGDVRCVPYLAWKVHVDERVAISPCESLMCCCFRCGMGKGLMCSALVSGVERFRRLAV